MTQYIAADALAGHTSAPSVPTASLMSANPFLSLWMLPLTLTQTWISAWAQSDIGSVLPHAYADQANDRHADTGETPTDRNDQIPVPSPLQDDRDGSVYA